MPEESLETKVAVLSTKVDHLSGRMDKALAWGRWIGMSVGGYIVIQLLESLQLLPQLQK